ncbi:hypothetical protein HPP92_016955 [Vanilla planifolia]|uniref:Reverse transcriptase domain-containing protein n=1 Tax=Vanilla planifolia TaxID=51239 RepID=A0A835QMF5_VANPL|nr:hypothetical protein HPP92_016955 [Vanilla planifolia]
MAPRLHQISSSILLIQHDGFPGILRSAVGHSYYIFFFFLFEDPEDIPSSSLLKIITVEQGNSLVATVTNDEIKSAAMLIGKNKAPSMDGISAEFITGYLHITHSDIIAAVKQFFIDLDMPKQWKDTLVVLVPKIQGANKPEQFRPISLCNVIYTIVAKILVKRLKRVLSIIMANEQRAFVPSRSIFDNVFLAQEVAA